MGRLVSSLTQRTVFLETDTLVGRSSRCTLQLGNVRVSNEHASIHWSGDGWLLRDLGSLNGTWMDGRRLAPGETVPLRQGVVLHFGDAGDSWLVAELAAPVAMAVRLEGGPTVVAPSEGLLPLPSSEKPIVTVHRDEHGGWYLDRPGEPGAVENGALVEVGSRRYRLSLPNISAQTTPVEGAGVVRIADVALTFYPSEDLEHIEVEAAVAGRAAKLGARGHNELLLVLARMRQADCQQHLPPPNCGWMYQDQLCRDAAVANEHLDVVVYRIRRQFSRLPVIDPASIIQRRRRSRQIRLGTGHVREVPGGSS